MSQDGTLIDKVRQKRLECFSTNPRVAQVLLGIIHTAGRHDNPPLDLFTADQIRVLREQGLLNH